MPGIYCFLAKYIIIFLWRNEKMRKHLKGIVIGFLIAMLLFGSIQTVLAAATAKKIDVYYDNYKIYVDGVEFKPTDKNGLIEPFSYNGWIYAPFEHIAKALGKEAYWDGNTKSLYLGNRKRPTAALEEVKLQDITQENRQGGFVYADPIKVGDVLVPFFGPTQPGTNERDFFLGNKFSHIEGTFFISGLGGFSASLTSNLEIYGDGELLYSSGNFESNYDPKNFYVDLNGVMTMKIIVNGVVSGASTGIAATVYKYK